VPASLPDRLRERIAREGPISFAAYMEAALFDPDGGYYARAPTIGPGGGFTTVPTALPLFARALAAELRRLHDGLRRPDPFTVVEIGPGNGALAAGLARELADLPLDLVLCDRSDAMLARAAAAAPTARTATVDELAPVTGAIVANEVHDALPAHRVRWPHELLVGVGPDRRFRLEPGQAPPEAVGAMLRAAGVEPRDGSEYEVSPAQPALQASLAGRLHAGALWVFDYGEAGRLRYERPVPRLRTYLAGRRGGDALAAPGTQDITVDVDFGALRAAGEAAGLVTTLDVDQAAWLRGHGALDELARHAAGTAERLWLQSLAARGGSGESFRVLVQQDAATARRPGP
jgi:SAM-dependent MidA family methyltransferase